MDGGAILFILCVIYFVLRGDDGKPVRHEDVSRYDVLQGGPE